MYELKDHRSHPCDLKDCRILRNHKVHVCELKDHKIDAYELEDRTSHKIHAYEVKDCNTIILAEAGAEMSPALCQLSKSEK